MTVALNATTLSGHAHALTLLAELVRTGAMTRASAERFAAGLIAGATQFLSRDGNELWAAEVLCRIADDACDRVPAGDVGEIVRRG